ncbi:ester cyclase [Streptomyces sp. NPDC002250]|uniref:ester cyclase n=1 Tax=Streptomyces sp. NPDC002250 TaxID=3364641 RepID=UPI00368E0482
MTADRTSGGTTPFGRLHDAVRTGDPEVVARTVDEVVDPGLVFHAPLPTGVTGVQALKEVWTVLLRAFPDLRVEVEDVITEGDKVVCRNTVTGTHLGEYRGLAPTGRPVRYGEIFVFRLAGGRIAEIWGVVDVLAQLRQLGAVDV